MGNIATNTSVQIKLLADRGMILDYEEAKIKEILLDIGYYRLGFYWYPFEKNENHEFQDDTKFSNVVALYYLDVDLRNIIIKYLNRIELNFRTKLIYYVSNKYKTSSTWFIDPKVMESDYISKFNDYYDSDFVNNNKQIKNHHLKYGPYAPAWKTLEFFTFGSILKTFKSLKEDDIKQRISEIYGIKNIQKFINLFETIVYVRNCCAHSSVVFDLNLPKSISAFAEIKFNGSERHNLDSCLKVISFILGKISESRRDEMNKAIDELFIKCSENEFLKTIIETKTGYKFV
jgi:abortive infection bacteriophage resistance protein